jgi:tRNA G18 (ribose-2'-O)-methylase SpoU
VARRYLAGVAAIEAALVSGEEVRVLLVERGDRSDEVERLCALSRQRGVAVWLGSPGDLRRMSREAEPSAAMAMLGPSPRATLSELMARDGAVWLLAEVTYPSNAGFALRTAEVSGAEGVVLDAAFNHEARSRASHVGMGADKLLPVLYATARDAIAAARAADRRIVAIEDSGAHAPWEVELGGHVLLVIGAERSGISAELLAACDQAVRIPMAGFIPSYNLQAAMSIVAGERLRQQGMR